MTDKTIYYSLNKEDFIFEELCDMCDEEINIGDTIYSGVGSTPTALDLINSADVLDIIERKSWDIAREFSENVISEITDEAKQELDNLIEAWVNKHIVINFYEIFDIKEITVTEEIYNEIYN